MVRAILLYLSHARWARRLLMALPGAKRVARRFVAGETLGDAMRVARELNGKGIVAILDYLGESVHSEPDALRARDAYVELLETIKKAGIQASISLKLTQLGLDISEDLCMTNMRHIMKCAADLDVFVWIDMESTAYTERTLRTFRTLRDEYQFENVGIVIQAYLRRSEADVRALAEEGAVIRLCKGAYKEPPDLAFPEKKAVDANFVRLLGIYLNPEARARGAYIGVATHDDNMLNAAKALAQQHHLSKDDFEFQMLYGVRGAEQLRLAAEGYKMRVYIPYGTEWYPYYMRRLAERPANVWFVARNLLRA